MSTNQVAMYSCDYSRDSLKQSYHAGAIDFIEKSAEPQGILSKVRTYCNRYDELLKTIRPSKNKSENRRLLESIGMEGQSSIMADVALRLKKLQRHVIFLSLFTVNRVQEKS